MQAPPYLQQLVEKALKNISVSLETELHFEHPAEAQFGDYSSNVALHLYPQLPEALGSQYSTPRQLAQAVVDQMHQILENDSSLKQVVAQIEVAGPGFINFTLSPVFLFHQMQLLQHGINQQLQTELAQELPQYFDRKIIVEYSSPNIAKPFTIGHLRSTIIGDALANILEAIGAEVYRDNHLGDWGTQFGKQIYAIKQWGNEAELDQAARPVKLLVELYVKFHQAAETHPEIVDKGRAWFKKLEDGDPEARRLWQKCIDWSWKEFDQIYHRLNIHFTENEGRGYGESYFEDKMQPIIDELKQKQLLTESEGAQLVFFPNESLPPLMITKKDGATLYSTRDLATDKFRLDHYGANTLIINEVGAEQSLYFKQLFETERLLGWVDSHQRIHIGHGLYRFKDKKMSTRKGNVIWLEDVLLEAFERVQKRAKTDLPDELLWKIAIGALKWHDLKREATKNVIFDFDEMLSLQGNSGPYLQYTYVRCTSILEKAHTNKSNITEYFDILLNNKSYLMEELNVEEKDLLRNIYKYYETVKHSSQELAPHYLCTYLYTLAQLFNSFYSKHSVLGDNVTPTQQQFRLALTASVGEIIQQGLAMLGIETVDQM